MCKEHFNEALSLLAMIGENVPSCVEVVIFIRDTDRPVATIVTNVTIDETIERFQRALASAEEIKRQAIAGVLPTGEMPPTAH